MITTNDKNVSTKNKAWIDTNIAEMKKFLGLVIIMGIVKKKARKRRLLVYPSRITYTYFREHNAKKQISVVIEVLALQ